MEHLVESHLGGYYISDRSEEDIEQYCEECGDYDKIVLSWEPNTKMEIFMNYFNSSYFDKQYIQECYNDWNLTNKEIIDIIIEQYDIDMCTINYLYNENVISKQEMNELLKYISLQKNEKLNILKEVHINNKPIVKKLYKNS